MAYDMITLDADKQRKMLAKTQGVGGGLISQKPIPGTVDTTMGAKPPPTRINPLLIEGGAPKGVAGVPAVVEGGGLPASTGRGIRPGSIGSLATMPGRITITPTGMGAMGPTSLPLDNQGGIAGRLWTATKDAVTRDWNAMPTLPASADTGDGIYGRPLPGGIRKALALIGNDNTVSGSKAPTYGGGNGGAADEPLGSVNADRSGDYGVAAPPLPTTPAAPLATSPAASGIGAQLPSSTLPITDNANGPPSGTGYIKDNYGNQIVLGDNRIDRVGKFAMTGGNVQSTGELRTDDTAKTMADYERTGNVFGAQTKINSAYNPTDFRSVRDRMQRQGLYLASEQGNLDKLAAGQVAVNEGLQKNQNLTDAEIMKQTIASNANLDAAKYTADQTLAGHKITAEGTIGAATIKGLQDQQVEAGKVSRESAKETQAQKAATLKELQGVRSTAAAKYFTDIMKQNEGQQDATKILTPQQAQALAEQMADEHLKQNFGSALGILAPQKVSAADKKASQVKILDQIKTLDPKAPNYQQQHEGLHALLKQYQA